MKGNGEVGRKCRLEEEATDTRGGQHLTLLTQWRVDDMEVIREVESGGYTHQ
jgi:hypothetical protein